LSSNLKQVKGFAPIGMMEQWNSGIMGSGIMQRWLNGPATGGIDKKIKMANIPLKTNIPSFSPRRRFYEPGATIPLFHFRGKFGSPKKPLFSQ
jgi:hypothetical protein